MKNIITGVKVKPNKPSPIRVHKNFYKLNGEGEILSDEIVKMGNVKRKFPIHIKEIRCTYYTIKKLKGKALENYIEKRITEYNLKFKNLSCDRKKQTNKNRKPITKQPEI